MASLVGMYNGVAMENNLVVPPKLNKGLPYDPEIPRYRPKRIENILHKNVYTTE